MLLKTIRYIKGYIRIRITGYSTERFLNACSHKGIVLWGLTPVNRAYEMNIETKGFRQLKPIIRKTGTKVTIVRKSGLPFYLYQYRKRKLFFVGVFCCVFLIFGMSRYIWNIDITGNLTRTDETLLEFLATKSVKNGMAKSEVDCQRIVKDIRKEYDDIIWVSASIRGTRLIIQVKENEDSAETTAYKEEDEPVKTPVDIVADRDCTLEDAIVRKGLLQAKIGKKVKKGDVLVSGQVPVNNDAGETVGYQYQISDADLTGKTVLKYRDSCENTYIRKEEPGIVKQEHYLKIGKVRVALGGIKNQYEHFTMTGEQWQLRLFDNFYFPVYWGERKAVPYIAHEEPYSQEEIQQILTQRFVSYCEDLEKKGVEIIENNVKIYTGSKTSEAKGRLTVRMPVGTEKKSELIKIPDPKEKEETGEQPDGNDGNSH